jgi:hypothetical protein
MKVLPIYLICLLLSLKNFCYGQKDFISLSFSPNYSWFNRLDSKSQNIKQVPQLGAEFGLGFNFYLNHNFQLESGLSLLCLRNKTVSTIEGSDIKINDGELFNRLNLKLNAYYVISVSEKIQGALSVGTTSTFGAKLKSEFINEIHEYRADTYRNWNQLIVSGMGIYYTMNNERKMYYGIRASFGLRNIASKKVIHLSEENNYVNRNNHCSIVVQYFFK